MEQQCSAGLLQFSHSDQHAPKSAMGPRVARRWEHRMRTERMSVAHWRKSAQWFALARPLAQVVATDDHVAPVFERECYTYAPNGKVPAPPHVKARPPSQIT